MKRFLILLLSCISWYLHAQKVEIVPSIEPEFFQPDQEITVTYNATGTPLANLEEAYIWVWLPNQTDYNVPTNINPASDNPSATEPAKFSKQTQNGTVTFTITFTPTEFTGQSAANIDQIGILIKGNDWGDGQSIDFIAEVTDGLTVRFNSPSQNYDFLPAGTTIDIDISSSESARLVVLVDEDTIAEVSAATSLIASHPIIADGQAHSITAIAQTASEQSYDYYSYITTPVTVEEAARPEGRVAGINYHADSSTVTLVLTAPGKDNAFVIGDFSNWQLDQDFLMKRDGDYFWITLPNLDKDREYFFQYLIDGEIKIADPYTEKIISPYDDNEIIQDNRYPGLREYPAQYTEEAVSVIHINRPHFVWSDDNYTKPDPEDLVIYELLVRDFTEDRTYDAVLQRLDYLDSLGINAIQFMPVMEFEGNLSWGYNPAFMTAPDKFYGTENDFKRLVDEAHNRGIAVILDIALNHAFGQSALVRLYNQDNYGAPTADNPWLNPTPRHDFNVGYDFNHETVYTQAYVDRVVKYWIEEYHVDGYRYDLSKGFTQKYTLGNVGAWGAYDANRVRLLKRLADVQWSADPDSYVILEHFADNSEETELANYGMLLWGNLNHDYRRAAKGSIVDLGWLYHERRGWDNPGVIGYMESHDEERVAWDLAQASDQVLAYQMLRLQLNAAFFYLVPGPKMLWQFGEFGYDVELNDDRLGVKPTKWEYLNVPERRKLFQVTQSLMKLKTQTEYLDNENFIWKPSGSFKWLFYDNPDVKIYAVGNFNNFSNSGDLPYITNGTWYNYFTGEQMEVGGDSTVNLTLAAGEFRIFTSEPIDNYLGENIDILLNVEQNDQAENRFQLFPNPAHDQILLSTPGGAHVKGLNIYSVEGKKMSFRFEEHAEGLQISIGHLDAGIYIMTYSVDNIVFKEKFVKE